MKMESANPGRLAIEAYGAGGFRIGGERHEGDLLLDGQEVRPWTGHPIEELALAESVDLLIVGTGADVALPDRQARDALAERGIGIEVMPTAAACRTYNVLLAEGRNVAAALKAV